MPSRTASVSLAAISVALLCVAEPAPAGDGYVVADVIRVLMNGDATYGGCMAALSVGPDTVLPACSPWWVTFSCSGDFTDPIRAYRMVDVAELALATSKKVQVFFRDDLKHNGYCFAYRIDAIR